MRGRFARHALALARLHVEVAEAAQRFGAQLRIGLLQFEEAPVVVHGARGAGFHFLIGLDHHRARASARRWSFPFSWARRRGVERDTRRTARPANDGMFARRASFRRLGEAASRRSASRRRFGRRFGRRRCPAAPASRSPCDSVGASPRGAVDRAAAERRAIVDGRKREARLDLVRADAFLLLLELVARQRFEQAVLLFRDAGEPHLRGLEPLAQALRRARRTRRCC